MDRFVIRGGVPLRGTVHISGAKNAALPCLAASLLTDEPVTLDNLPAVRDIQTTIQLLRTLGVSVEGWPLAYGSFDFASFDYAQDGQDRRGSDSSREEIPRVRRRLQVQAGKLTSVEAPWELVRTMRASTLILGTLVARCGGAGC